MPTRRIYLYSTRRRRRRDDTDSAVLYRDDMNTGVERHRPSNTVGIRNSAANNNAARPLFMF